MTAPIAQSESVHAAREKLPPVENNPSNADAVPAAAVNPTVSARTAAYQPSIEPSDYRKPTDREVRIGKWLHQHRNATEGFGGYMGYQVVRNVLAAIPYAVATAGVWLGLEKVAEKAIAKDATSLVAKAARSPLRDVAMIAAGFTLYRGTLKVVRYMKERLFNPNHNEAESIAEVQNFGTNLKDTLIEVGPAEVASTPAAAFALGIGRRFWNPTAVAQANKEAFIKSGMSEAAAALESSKHSVTGLFFGRFKPDGSQTFIPKGERLERLKKTMLTKKGGYLAEAGIIAASFVPFFELGDRRYKDAQVSRGIWLNDPTSLIRKSDEQAKRELDASSELFAKASATDDSHEEIARRSAESIKATGHLRPADPPTFACFAMRRVVPTFLGIGAYVAGKRLAYMGMGTIPENYNAAAKGFGGFLKNLGRISLIEGAATSLFWLNSAVIDKYEPWYDKTFKDSKPKPLTDPEIRRHYAELKEKLDAKERDRRGSQTSVA